MLVGWWQRGGESLKCLVDKTGHGDLEVAGCIIPVEGDATIQASRHVDGDDEDFLDNGAEVVEVGDGGVFYVKVFEDQSEGDIACAVAEEAMGVTTMVIAVFGEEGAELGVG